MQEISSIRFAAFVMTYKRPDIAVNTIKELFKQTLVPEKVLIIDNDPACSAANIINILDDLPLEYFSLGYNSGPAGAAAKGLEILSNQGFDWISWIDDDDPPVFRDSFEVLINAANQISNCGCVGAVGQFFDAKTGFIKLVPEELLLKSEVISVDTIAGGMLKIVNGEMIRKYSIYPDKDLFFGFEDLDFDLKIKSLNYSIVVPCNLFLKHRLYFKEQKRILVQKNKTDITKVWRTYYSVRSLLNIFFRNGLYVAFIFTLFRYLVKILKSFMIGGVDYGLKNFKLTFLAFNDFIFNKKGERKGLI